MRTYADLECGGRMTIDDERKRIRTYALVRIRKYAALVRIRKYAEVCEPGMRRWRDYRPALRIACACAPLPELKQVRAVTKPLSDDTQAQAELKQVKAVTKPLSPDKRARKEACLCISVNAP